MVTELGGYASTIEDGQQPDEPPRRATADSIGAAVGVRLASMMTAGAIAVASAAGCSGPASYRVAIVVDHPTTLADAPLGIRIAGLGHDERVTISAATTDGSGRDWQSFGTFQADARGVIDLASATPSAGTYSEPDAMGLFWSMVSASPASGNFLPPAPAMQVTLTVRDQDRTLATRRLTRQYLMPGVTMRSLTLARDGFIGRYYAPPATTPRPAVLAFAGSAGGLTPILDAVGPLLASHGFPTLTIAYFGLPGLPTTLANVPLEYFIGALGWLRSQPGVDRGHVLTYGISRGSEAALLLGANRPDLVQGVIALVPSDVAICSFPGCAGPAWMLNGVPLPYTRQFDQPYPTDDPGAVIQVERIAGPVLLVCAESDEVWTSCPYAQAIERRLDQRADPHQHLLLSYPGARHIVGYLVPYQPDTGRRADALGQAQAWPRLLGLLNRLAGSG